MHCNRYPNVPPQPAVMARPYNVEPQTALAMLGWAHELVRDTASQDEQANACCRAEAARTLDCLALVLAGEPAASARAYLALVTDNIRRGGYEWALYAISRLRFAWG